MNEKKDSDDFTADRSLVALFLRMTPEERIEANNNSMRAILEMREAFLKIKGCN